MLFLSMEFPLYGPFAIFPSVQLKYYPSSGLLLSIPVFLLTGNELIPEERRLSSSQMPVFGPTRLNSRLIKQGLLRPVYRPVDTASPDL